MLETLESKLLRQLFDTFINCKLGKKVALIVLVRGSCWELIFSDEFLSVLGGFFSAGSFCGNFTTNHV